MTVVSQDAPPPIASSATATTGASAASASATAGSGRSKSVSPSGSSKSSSPTKKIGGKPFGKTHGGGFNSLPLSPSPSPQSMATMGRDDSTMSRNDLTLQRRGSHYDLDFQKRDSVSNIHREADPHSTTFFHRDFDKDIHVFTEVPEVKVLGGRSEEAWPTRYVEYDVELNYKNFKWQVEIPKSTLYGLWFFIKSQFNIKFPSAGHSHRGDYSAWPQMRKLFLATAEKSISPEMIALIQQYLDAVVRVPRLLSSAYVVSMFQVSNSTFDDEEGYTSVREGWLKVRIWLKGNNENVRINRGAITCDNECFNCMCVVKRVNFKSKKWRWVALKHSSIAVYPSLQDTKATEAFLFDHKFNIERGIHSAGSNTALLVSNSTYVLQLEAKTKQSILKWANAIRKVAEKSTWSQSHRDDSFAIPRHPNQIPSYARWFVDGSDAYESIYEGICSAKKEIYIAGWWICPTIHLLRPAALYPHSRLDQVLLKKAEEGVKIYILMYKELTMALTLNSNFSKQIFRRLHDNIHVLRDPDFLMKQLGMWSHHEKIVCIDQKVSFVGGLDLCFGRWDTRDHVLFDNPGQGANFLGKDYSNPRVKDFIEVHLPERDLVDRTKVPRMPWHDCHSRLEGQPARDVARHFIQRWNYSVSTRRKTSKLHHLVPMKDYERYVDKHQYSSQLLNKRLQKAQLSRVLSCDGITTPFEVMNDRNSEDEQSEQDEEENEESVYDAKRGFPCNSQILRSLSLWSGGCPTERSIQNAYLRLISSANHFVYIENQFFVSGLDGDHGCSNRIANAIVERIRKAAANQEKFRVMVVMPLLPAFPGKPDDKDASSLRGVMYWQYRSICRGENSIYHTLFKELDGLDPFEYIAFYGLRTHSVEGGQPHTEQVYVHSKIMIVDDKSCIIGSANINERSMTGDRDSEIAVLVDDTEMDETVRIANGTASVGKFAHSFRMKLFEEHFGVEPGTPLYEKYQDPVSYHSWFAMQDHAMKNSQIYDSVFGCLPSDNVVSFKQIHLQIDPLSKRDNLPGQAKSTIQQPSPKMRARGESPANNVNHAFGSPSNANINPDAVVNDNQVEPEVEVSKSSKNKSPKSDEDSKHEGEEGDSESRNRLHELTREDSTILSGAMVTHMRENSQITVRKHELSGIQGQIVYFPLKFLADEVLEPKLFPAELFQ
uniref:Phospholipase n=1 Tax=Globisporangium ultimum (strain ATCC 200006 / CBS 805.95 / DAOM BR144) TaxID=431595 RepID=K3WPY3_GLOUD